MNTKYSIISIVFFSCLLFASTIGWSQPSDSGGMGLTWQDLQELLELNTEKVRLTWPEFRKLLEQTGNQVTIDFEDHDGIVTLKREHFQQLLKNMKPVDASLPRPPRAYLIPEVSYTGTAGDQNTRFTANFKIHIFDQAQPAYLTVPLVHTSVALRDVRIDGTPAVIVTNGEWHGISLNQPGYHDVTAVFSIEQDRHSLSLPVVRAIINRLDFTMADLDMEISVDQSVHAALNTLPDGIRLSGWIPPTDHLDIAWVRKSEKRVKRPPLFYATTRTLLAVDADILRINTQTALEIVQGNLNSVSLVVPEHYEVIAVDGEAVSEWRVRETEIGHVLDIPFRYDINRTVTFSVRAERILTAGSLAADFTGFQVLDARRETGDIGVIAESAVEVQMQESQELEHIEYHNVPQDMMTLSSRPILFAFTYAKHPYQLDISITKHERMQGMTTVIESADATVLFLKEGKMLYHIDYTVRNTFKQFMELTLPPHASIWTVYVDNARAKASRNDQGNVLIPLVRSSGDGVKPFRVELLYTLPVREFGFTGKTECALPSSDIFTNKILLSLYLPTGFNYEFDDEEWGKAVVTPYQTPDTTQIGDDEAQTVLPKAQEKAPMESKEEEPAIIDGFTGTVPEDRLEPQRDKGDVTVQAMTGPAGLSSIQVYLPLSGEQMAFTKTVVDRYETFPLQFSYTNRLLKKRITTGLIIVVIIGLMLIVFKIRARRRSIPASP